MAGVDEYTKLLLHCDGADASTTFTDNSGTGKTVTANGNAQIDTAQSKFGGASALFDGTGDYLSIPDNGDWDLGSNDFTIDFWVYFNSTVGEQNFGGNYSSNGVGWIFRQTGATLEFTDGVGYVSVAGGYSAGSWYHVALVRTGSVYKFFVGGTQVGGNQTAFAIGNSANNLYIGRHPGAEASYLNGYMDEIRLSNTARWTANFTPPTSAYSKPSGFMIFL